MTRCQKTYYDRKTKKQTRCKGRLRPEFDWCPRCLDREYHKEMGKRYFPSKWNKDLIIDLTK